VALRPDGSLEVWTTVPPVDGRANTAVCNLIADELGVGHRDVRVATGASGRTKILEIADMSNQELRERLAAKSGGDQ
jgi:uncharacterized protein